MKKAAALVAFALALEGALILQLAVPAASAPAPAASAPMVQAPAARPPPS